MIEPRDCTVRYWLGPTAAVTRQPDNKYYRAFTEILDSHRDLLPPYTIDSELDDLYLYCAWPVSDHMKGVVYNYTNGLFSLWHEFEL